MGGAKKIHFVKPKRTSSFFERTYCGLRIKENGTFRYLRESSEFQLCDQIEKCDKCSELSEQKTKTS